MVSAISADLAAPSRTASTTRRNYHFAYLPDLNRETKHRISEASAWATFTGICLMLRHEKRKGRTAAIRQAADANEEIGVGLRHLARDMGLSVSTVRRHVRHLEEIGVIKAWRPNVTFYADLATGRIKTKAKGRCENTRLYLTIQPHHLRPAKAGMGADCTHQPVESSPCKAQSAPTVRESKNQRTPDGDAVGIGTPPAVPAGRLPAAEAGGHAAAKAGQEGTPVVPADAGRDEPVLPAGRLLRSAPNAAPPRRTNRHQEEHAPPREFTGAAADALERTRQRLAAAKASAPVPDVDLNAGIQAAFQAAKAARKAEASAAPPPNADEAADRLREALSDIPDERRDLLRRDVERQADAADPEAAMLAKIVRQRQKAMADEAKAERAAKAQKYRKAYHREAAGSVA